jgi:hypothetical protein
VLELVFPDPLFAARVDTVDEAKASLNGASTQPARMEPDLT